MDILSAIIGFLAAFAFCYPLLMAYVLMEGAIFYYYRYEHKKPRFFDLPQLREYPLVSLMVPCYNEGYNIMETIEALSQTKYPNYEIIAVNDGSKDNTLEILMDLRKTYPRLRVINLATNQGKAVGLKTAVVAAKGEFVVCVDGDSFLDPHALHWFMSHFLSSPRVGAVTGNPRVRTRSTLIGQIQVGEFSAIIGLMKRAQRIFGRVFTISGVAAAYRKAALSDVGYWNDSVQTEDIEISWNLQLTYWDVRFEPRSICWVLMPETLKGLVRQRYRWAMGGAQTFKRYTKRILQWKSRRFWTVYVEYFISVAWAYTILVVTVLWGIRFAASGWDPNYIGTFYQGPAIILGATCLLQFFVSMKIDTLYDYKLMRNYLAIIWYPIVYWIMNCILPIVIFPQVMFVRAKTQKKRGTWISPDRGVHQMTAAPAVTAASNSGTST